MGRRAVHASLLLCAAMWGLVFVGVHELLPVLTPVQLVTVRFLIVSVIFLVAFALVPSMRLVPERGDWWRFVLSAVLAVPAAQLAVVDGQRYLSPQLASLVVSIAPVMTAVFAVLLLGERFGSARAVGSLVAFAGVAFIVVFGAGGGAGVGLWGLAVSLPAIVIVANPVVWALYTVISRPLSGRYPPLASVGLTLTLGTVFLLPFASGSLRALNGISASEWGWILYLAVGGSFLPYLIWFASLRSLPANRTAAYMYVVPVFAMLWTWVVLGNPPGRVAILGGAIVLVGLALTQLGSE